MMTVGYYMGQRVQVLGRVPEDVHAAYMDGVCDEQTGSVDWLVGHVYRVGRYIVHTDSHGREAAYLASTEADAEAIMRMADAKAEQESEDAWEGRATE